jgi:hypothetical protein
MKPYAVWASEIGQMDIDILFHENSHRFPADLNSRSLPNHFKLIRCLSCPSTIGFPLARLRALETGINLSRWVWCGPDDEEAIFSKFATVFSRLFRHQLTISWWRPTTRF